MKRRRKAKPQKLKVKKTNNFSPGTVRYTGEREKSALEIEVVEYAKEFYTFSHSLQFTDVFKYKSTPHLSWIQVNGLNHTEAIVALGQHYEWHALVQEDIVSVNQRPKLNEYQNYIFVAFKWLQYDEQDKLVVEHCAVIMGKNYLVSFQEAEEDYFKDVRERIENARGRIRGAGADYLLFSLLDTAVDQYFTVMEYLDNKIEILEDKLFDPEEDPDISVEIQELKKEILKIRRAILPMREVISKLERLDNSLIEGRTVKYIRDLYDHIIQVSENLETQRELINSLMDMYLTTINNKMNEVMKVLTIMASIFIPLTFLTGIYGMNFEYMPELQIKYGFYYLLGIMVVLIFVMVWYFKRKKWF